MRIPIIIRSVSAFWIVVTVGFLLRLLFIACITIEKPPFIEYSTIAHNILLGNGYASEWMNDGRTIVLPTAFMPPLETFIHTIGYGLFGYSALGAKAILFFHCLFGAAFVYTVAKVTTLGFSRPVALAAAWVAALYPPFIYACGNFGITSLALLMGALSILTAATFIQRPTTKQGTLFGTVIGFLALLRGEGLFYGAALLGFFLWRHRKSAVALRPAILSIAVIAVMLTPWVIRNYIVLDTPVVTSTSFGLNLWRGNNGYTNGSAWTESGGAMWTSDELWDRTRIHLNESEAFEPKYSTIYTSDALSWMSARPLEVIKNDIIKAVTLWTIDLRSREGRNPLYIGCYLLFITFVISGVIAFRHSSEHLREALTISKLIGVWCVCATLITMIFFSLPRFQILLCGVLTPFAGYGLLAVVEKIRTNRSLISLNNT